MKLKKLTALMLAAVVALTAMPHLTVKAASENEAMYRMYNQNTGEHFYTSNQNEKIKLTNIGWMYEGISWISPTSGDPVYRLYNPNTGDHHYTTNAGEKDLLVAAGWSYENVGWYSYPNNGGVPMYRLYNPNATVGSHHYTSSAAERDSLVANHGWKDEGIGWYAIPDSISITPAGFNDIGGNLKLAAMNLYADPATENVASVTKLYNGNPYPVSVSIGYTGYAAGTAVKEGTAVYAFVPAGKTVVQKVFLPKNTTNISYNTGSVEKGSFTGLNNFVNASMRVEANEENSWIDVTLTNTYNSEVKGCETYVLLYDSLGQLIDAKWDYASNISPLRSDTLQYNIWDRDLAAVDVEVYYNAYTY